MSKQNGQPTTTGKKQLEKSVSKEEDLKITQQDVMNLEAVFSNARANVVDNEKQLIGIINFKGAFMEKITNVMRGYLEKDPDESKLNKK